MCMVENRANNALPLSSNTDVDTRTKLSPERTNMEHSAWVVRWKRSTISVSSLTLLDPRLAAGPRGRSLNEGRGIQSEVPRKLERKTRSARRHSAPGPNGRWRSW